jgi:hypothetical protein
MRAVTTHLVILLILAGAGQVAAPAVASMPEGSSTYQLKALFTDYTAYYSEVSGLPISARVGLNAGPGSVVATDGAGKITGVADLAVPSVGGRFIVDVRGAISRPAAGATAVSLTLKGNGYALNQASNTAPASLSLTFKATPLQFAPQTVPVITINTNVALLFSDGSVDTNGSLIWQTNLQPVVPPVTNSTPAYTNNFTIYTITNLLFPDGTLFPIGSVSSEYVVPATNTVIPGITSFSFTNDWPFLQGTLKGTIRAGGQSWRINDNAATLVETHFTNWQGAPLTIANVFYATVYSLMVTGSLDVTVLDSLNSTVIQAGKHLYLAGTNYSGQGTVSVNTKTGLSTSKGTLKGIGSSRGSSLSFAATNGTLITSYDINSNTAPVVVTFTNSIGVPPVFSVSNSVSGILIINDVVNYLTNGNIVLESHYGPADLTNPIYITNSVPGALKTLTFSGKIQGQTIPASTAVNLDAQYQLLPLGTTPPVLYPF